MRTLELHLHDRRVGTVVPDARDRTRVALEVDPGYRQEVLLSESFATLSGRRLSRLAAGHEISERRPSRR